MSSDTPPSHRRDRGRGEPEPMLVLGENRPEVEDSTPEQLRRQQEELRREVERQRRQAQERIERERAEHRELLEQQRRRHEEELRRRQDQLDDAQRRVNRESSRLRRKMTWGEATVSGLPRLRPVPDVPLHRSWWKLILLTVACVALVVTGMTAAQPGGPQPDEAIETFLTHDEARTAWLRTTLALDGAVAGHLAGDDAETLAERSLLLAEDAASYDTKYADLYLEDVTDALLDLPEGASDVRTLGMWQDVRPSTTYAVSMTDVRDTREEAASPWRWAPWVGAGALLVLVLLIVRARRSERPAEMGLFVSAMIPALLLVAYATFVRPATGAVEIHETSLTAVQAVPDQADRDLRIAYGLRPPSTIDTYWTGPQMLEGLPPGPELDAVLAARAELGQQIETADTQEVYAAATTLTGTMTDLFERQAGRSGQAAYSLAHELRTTSPVAGLVLAGLSILCAAGAVVLSAVRKS